VRPDPGGGRKDWYGAEHWRQRCNDFDAYFKNGMKKAKFQGLFGRREGKLRFERLGR